MNNALRHALGHLVELDFYLCCGDLVAFLPTSMEEQPESHRFHIPVAFRDIGTSVIKNQKKSFILLLEVNIQASDRFSGAHSGCLMATSRLRRYFEMTSEATQYRPGNGRMY